MPPRSRSRRADDDSESEDSMGNIDLMDFFDFSDFTEDDDALYELLPDGSIRRTQCKLGQNVWTRDDTILFSPSYAMIQSRSRSSSPSSGKEKRSRSSTVDGPFIFRGKPKTAHEELSRIVVRMRVRGWSQKDIAEELGVAQPTVSSILAKERVFPKPKRARKRREVDEEQKETSKRATAS